MVLILVDGKSTVSDLVLKIGNQQLTESALVELEEGGFISLRLEQDSLWSESKKVAQEIREAALSKATQIVSPGKIPDKTSTHSPRPYPLCPAIGANAASCGYRLPSVVGRPARSMIHVGGMGSPR